MASCGKTKPLSMYRKILELGHAISRDSSGTQIIGLFIIQSFFPFPHTAREGTSDQPVLKTGRCVLRGSQIMPGCLPVHNLDHAGDASNVKFAVILDDGATIHADSL